LNLCRISLPGLFSCVVTDVNAGPAEPVRSVRPWPDQLFGKIIIFFVSTRHISRPQNCPVRRTVTCGGGTPYQQFLVSQRRYAVYLQCSKYHKNVKLLHARCAAQAQNASKLVFGRGCALNPAWGGTALSAAAILGSIDSTCTSFATN